MKKLSKILFILSIFMSISFNLFAIESRFYSFKVIKEFSLERSKKHGIYLENIKISPEKMREIYNFISGGRIVIGYYLYSLEGKLEIFHTNRKLRGTKDILIPKFIAHTKKLSKFGLNISEDKFITGKNYKIFKESIDDILFLDKIEKKFFRAKLLDSNFLNSKIFDDLKIYFDMFKKSGKNCGLNIISIIRITQDNYIVETESEDIGYGKNYILLLLKDGRARKVYPFFYRKNNETLLSFFDYFSSSFLIINNQKSVNKLFNSKNRKIISEKNITHLIFKNESMEKENILIEKINRQLFRILHKVQKKVGKFQWNLKLDNEYVDLTRFYFRINFNFFKGGKRIGETHISYVFEFDTNILSKM